MTTRVTATIEIDGDSLQDVVDRLYDIMLRLDEHDRTLPVQMVGGHHIVTVREADKAPKIDWREGTASATGVGRGATTMGWKVPEPTGNPEVDRAAARAWAARVNAYIPTAAACDGSPPAPHSSGGVS